MPAAPAMPANACEASWGVASRELRSKPKPPKALRELSSILVDAPNAPPAVNIRPPLRPLRGVHRSPPSSAALSSFCSGRET